jgi:DNA polymerase I-like protein with 3'-5' exonuclease and polymerase domains
MVAAMQREAQNFPIQSTVADTCLLALAQMVQYRKDYDLHFRIVNQIHDAIMLEVPELEIEPTKQMYKDTMGNIQIPVPNSEPLVLSVDIDILDRWGAKRKKEV